MLESGRDRVRPLRIALCVYRGNPYSGGQGVYTKHLAIELARLGHHVEVFSGPPYPDLDIAEVKLRKLGSLDLYPFDDPFRVPKLSEFKSMIDVIEFAIMVTGGFPEPRSFGWRLEKDLKKRRDEFDIIHDNQSLSWSILRLATQGWPVIGSIHHPITVDRKLAIEHARSVMSKFGAWRWYGFVKMQSEVARRLDRIVTVSQSSKMDLVKSMSIDKEKIQVVPIGVDTNVFRPNSGIAKEKGLIVTTASADVPLKGLDVLVDALGDVVALYPDVRLVIMGKPNQDSRLPEKIIGLGLEKNVSFAGIVSQAEMVNLYNRAELAVVPSLYEGFSLPTIEAMACGTPIVVTDGGALPEVVGSDGENALIARSGDARDLAKKILSAIESPLEREERSASALERVRSMFTWSETAKATERLYLDLLITKGFR